MTTNVPEGADQGDSVADEAEQFLVDREANPGRPWVFGDAFPIVLGSSYGSDMASPLPGI